MRQHIICYDIADPKRLGRIHRYLKRLATPIQYSVFLFTGTTEQLNHCWNHLASLIDPSADDIRAYPIPQRGTKLHYGHTAIPDDIHFAAGKIPFQALNPLANSAKIPPV